MSVHILKTLYSQIDLPKNKNCLAKGFNEAPKFLPTQLSTHPAG